MEQTPSILIEAGVAFGSGAHPSTALLLEILGVLGPPHDGGQLLDVGCGSGILSVTAAKLHTMQVIASDLQESAVLQTQRNAELNHVSDRIRCVQADGIRHPLIAASAPYDIILVNILYKVFLPWLRPLKDFLAPQGQLVLSGVLRWQADSLEEACVAAGFMKMQRYQKDDWVALCLSD